MADNDIIICEFKMILFDRRTHIEFERSFIHNSHNWAQFSKYAHEPEAIDFPCNSITQFYIIKHQLFPISPDELDGRSSKSSFKTKFVL